MPFRFVKRIGNLKKTQKKLRTIATLLRFAMNVVGNINKTNPRPPKQDIRSPCDQGLLYISALDRIFTYGTYACMLCCWVCSTTISSITYITCSVYYLGELMDWVGVE